MRLVSNSFSILNGFEDSKSVNFSKGVDMVTVSHLNHSHLEGYLQAPSDGGLQPVRLRESIGVTSRVLITLAFSILILFITLGNLATIAAILVYKRLRSVSNMYLASLATADLIVGLPVMTFMLLYTVTLNGKWVFGNVLCDIWTYVDFVACTASLTNVCAIAGDRFITLAQPLKSIRKRTKKRVCKVIAIAWAFPIVFWFVIITTLRAINGWSVDGECYLIWKPNLIAFISAVTIIYLPLAIILILFVAILGLLKHHMGSMNSRMHRSASYKDSFRDQSDELNAEQAGGISFNPRYSDANLKNTTDSDKGDIPMKAIHVIPTCPEMGHLVSTAVGPDDNPVSLDDEEHYILRGRKFRTVGTNTSPERFGLVRTIGVNTSPSLKKRDAACETNLSDVASVGKSLIDAASILSASAITSVRVIDPRSDESDTDTIKTFSTCSSSTSRESRTDESELSLVRLGTKWRRRYASLLRSERETSLERARLKQQVRAAKILGVIMGFLLVCWLPFAIMWPIRTICSTCISERMFDMSIWINYVNSAVNPVIYCLYNPSFRRAFAKLFIRRRPCGCHCSRVPPD